MAVPIDERIDALIRRLGLPLSVLLVTVFLFLVSVFVPTLGTLLICALPLCSIVLIGLLHSRTSRGYFSSMVEGSMPTVLRLIAVGVLPFIFVLLLIPSAADLEAFMGLNS